jgi:hypothetical protein
LYIKGLKANDFYAVYSVLGTVVNQGIAVGEWEQQVALPGKGLYIVSTQRVKKKILVE